MKAHFARVFAMAAAPIWVVLVSVVGCGAVDVSDPVVAEEQEAMSAEEESIFTEESALETAVPTSLAEPKGTCWFREDCVGPSYRAFLSASMCQLHGKSWRHNLRSPCINF